MKSVQDRPDNEKAKGRMVQGQKEKSNLGSSFPFPHFRFNLLPMSRFYRVYPARLYPVCPVKLFVR
jgi:hypothetical protein